MFLRKRLVFIRPLQLLARNRQLTMQKPATSFNAFARARAAVSSATAPSGSLALCQAVLAASEQLKTRHTMSISLEPLNLASRWQQSFASSLGPSAILKQMREFVGALTSVRNHSGRKNRRLALPDPCSRGQVNPKPQTLNQFSTSSRCHKWGLCLQETLGHDVERQNDAQRRHALSKSTAPQAFFRMFSARTAEASFPLKVGFLAACALEQP